MWGDDCCWPPPVLSRFAGSAPPAPPAAETYYAPSGYDQPISGTAVASPLPIMQDPTQGQFARGTGLPVGALSIHFQYIPTYAPSGIVGGGLFGGGAIGHRVPFHGMLVPQQVGGFTVYEPVPGGDQRK